jgi:hypothetical protein
MHFLVFNAIYKYCLFELLYFTNLHANYTQKPVHYSHFSGSPTYMVASQQTSMSTQSAILTANGTFLVFQKTLCFQPGTKRNKIKDTSITIQIHLTYLYTSFSIGNKS